MCILSPLGNTKLELLWNISWVSPLYCHVLVKDGGINQDLLAVGNNLPDNDIDFGVESDN